jgi:hypothetical protein
MLIKVADPANVDIRASLAKLPIVQTGKKKQQQQQQTDKFTPPNTNKQKAKIEKTELETQTNRKAGGGKAIIEKAKRMMR